MVSDEEFMDALKGLNMKVPDIAEKFSVSNNTIARWMVEKIYRTTQYENRF